MRIYQAAQQLGVASKDLLDLLKAQGVDVKSPASSIDEVAYRLAEQMFNGVGVLTAPAVAEPKAKAAAEGPAPIPAPKSARPTSIPQAKGAPKAIPSVEAQAPRMEEPPPAVEEELAPEPVVELAPEPEVEASPEPPVVEKAPPPPEPPAPPAKKGSKKAPEAPPPVQAAPEPPPSEPEPEPAPAVQPPPTRTTPPARPAPPPGPIPVQNRGMATLGNRPQPGSGGGGSTVPRRPQPNVRTPIGMAPLPPQGVRRPPSTPTGPRPVQTGPRPVQQYDPNTGPAPGRTGLVPVARPAPPSTGGPVVRRPGGAGPVDFDEENKKGAGPANKAKGGGKGGGIGDREGRRQGRMLAQKMSGEDDGEYRVRRRRHQQQEQRVSTSGPVTLETPITVRSFSAAAGIRADQVQKKLFATLNVIATINAAISEEHAQLLAMEFGLEVQIKGRQTAETQLEERLVAETDNPEDLLLRPPIVTFMGHVDHGKTSLMDRIRRTNVVAGEAGGITQHIGAYQVKLEDGRAVTFLDTPGHQAFTAMRARGANMTDVVVLVVAADDGVMPQTEEAISHAQAAGVTIVVAMNKSDLPGANPEKVQQQLSKYNLISEQWGGDTIMVPTSAVTGMGVPELLEALNLVAELKELKANPKRSATGNVVEASLDPDAGVRTTLLVRNGTLKKGDVVLCGAAFGRVRSIQDDRGNSIDEAGPSTPVVLFGLDEVPEAGQSFVVHHDLATAREIAEQRKGRAREAGRAPDQIKTLETLFERKLRDLNLIIKADVRGSLEALRKELGSFKHNEVQVRIIRDGIGAISESDVLLAHASDAIIVGFHVIADDKAAAMAADKGVEIRRYEIIYQVLDEIKKALEGLLVPESREVQLGRAIIQKTYSISRVGTIAGCRVVSGTIERNAKLRVIRDGVVIGTYPIESLRRVKDDVREVRDGLECGIKLAGYDDVKPGDLLEGFKIEEIKRTL